MCLTGWSIIIVGSRVRSVRACTEFTRTQHVKYFQYRETQSARDRVTGVLNFIVKSDYMDNYIRGIYNDKILIRVVNCFILWINLFNYYAIHLLPNMKNRHQASIRILTIQLFKDCLLYIFLLFILKL